VTIRIWRTTQNKLMTTELGQMLLLIAGLPVGLGALIAVLDRIESSMYDAVATRPDSRDVGLAVAYDAPLALFRLPEPRSEHSASEPPAATQGPLARQVPAPGGHPPPPLVA